MRFESIHFEGRLYLAIEVVAELYEVKSLVLQNAYERGLLGAGIDREHTVCIAAVELDRVATIVRMHETFGLDLEAIAKRLT